MVMMIFQAQNNGLSPNKVQLSPVVKPADAMGGGPHPVQHQVVVRRQLVNGAGGVSPVKILVPSSTSTSTPSITQIQNQPKIVAVTKQQPQQQQVVTQQQPQHNQSSSSSS